jgi:transcriptional regulator with XRE-family HTH domain
MTLTQYLWENRLTQQAFADKVGYTRNYISMICRGKIPSKRLIRDIEMITDGLVTRRDLVETKNA